MNYRETVNAALLEYQVASQNAQYERKQLEKAKIQEAATQEALSIAQGTAQLIQQRMHDQLANVVTRCLQAVFDESHTFTLSFNRRAGGRTEVKLAFMEDGQPIDPKTASSGGVVDIAAFALRLASLVISRPRRRLTVILDEPFRAVHGAEYRERTRQLIETLAAEMGIQIVLVTGVRELICGKVVEIE